MTFHDDFIGKQIGDFIIKERIGEGGMAIVYRATQRSVNRDVAVKVINFAKVPNPDEFRARFANEASIIAKLEHIHILPVHDYGIQDDIAYLAMRLLRGGSLRDLIRREESLSLDRIAQLFVQICQGLAYAHSKGIIHRDLKPANIMLDDTGNAYLTDFGLAKLITGQEEITKSGNIMGTLNYMAPEQLRGEKLDQRTDIYALGIILYQAVCGKTPYESDSASDIVGLIYKHLEGTPRNPSEVNPTIPPQLEEVILRAMAKNSQDRFASADDLADSIKAAAGLSSAAYHLVKPAIDSSKNPTPSASPIKTPWFMGGALALVVVIALLLAGPLGMGRAEPTPIPTAAATPTPIPRHTVRAGQEGNSDDVIPLGDDIAVARANLGENGFIAIIACNMSSEYHATLNREITEFARAYGFKTRIYDPDSDAYSQRTELEKAITEGATAFTLCPLDMSVLQEPLNAIEQAGLPLVYFADPEGDKYGGVILSSTGDNYDMGLTVGRYAGQIVRDDMNGQANVIILDFPDMDIIVDRANGMEDGLKEFAPDANIVGRFLGATQDNAEKSVQQLLDDEVDFDVILSINDAGSYGAIKVLEASEIGPDKVAVFSVDAETRAMDYIQEDYYIRGSLSVGRREGAQSAVNVLTLMLAGKSVPEAIILRSNQMVTKESIGE